MPLAALTNKLKAISSVRTGSFRYASEVPLVAENCRWQALHLNTRRHRKVYTAAQQHLGQIGAPSVSGHRIAQSILCAASSDRSHRSTSDRVRAAADMRKCCATAAVQEKGHGFLPLSELDVDPKCLIPLLGVNAP